SVADGITAEPPVPPKSHQDPSPKRSQIRLISLLATELTDRSEREKNGVYLASGERSSCCMDRRLILCTRALIETLEARFLMDGTGDVFYFDTGIGGDNGFNVSEPLYGAIAPFSPAVDGSDAAQFNTNVGPFRYETNPTPVNDPDLEEPLDIIGMPAIDGKVM